MAGIHTLQFDEKTRQMPWQDFFRYLTEDLNAAGLVCGADFRFGYRGEGNALLLQKACRDAGIPCGLFRVESFGDYLRMLEICCDITGNKEAFETYGTAVKEEIDGILSSAERKEEKILFLRAGSSERSTKAKTAGEHFAAAMLEELGAYNIADNAPVLLDGLSMEEIITENPGAVFITTMGDETAAVTYMRSRLETPEWQVLDAVKQGRVYFLPKDLFQFKPNHRWAEAYRMLTELLYEE